MRRQNLIALAAAGSLAMLLGAFAFQHLGGLAPCKMCLWQRWPHAAAVAIGAVALVVPLGVLIWAGAAAVATSGAIGLYHAGVEQGWWEGPSTCTSAPIGNLSAQELLDQIMAAPLARCDEIPWQMAGLSMAGWNAVISIALAVIWVLAARR
ncbi:MAG: disulfide bond formation protein B [Sedimentitalea sp.]